MTTPTRTGTIGCATILLLASASQVPAAQPEIPRDFDSSLPLFSGPLLEDVSAAAVLSDSDQQMLVDDLGNVIDEANDRAPITRMFFAALHTHGASGSAMREGSPSMPRTSTPRI